MKHVAIMGAGGKMGCRITRNLKDNPDYSLRLVEISPAGIENLKEFGRTPTPQDEALAGADIVVLAVPDKLIGRISHEIVPKLAAGTIVVGLDPAAAYAGVMPDRGDITYFVTHPCHTVLFAEHGESPDKIDWFGGVHYPQPIVCALHHGPEEHYAVGEALAREMFRPVTRSHRITVEQMAILEPALVETLSATLLTAINEAFEEAVAMGVPREAARDFLMGHLRTELAIIFGFAGFPFSDGAKLAIEKAKSRIFLPNWKENVMNLDRIKESVAEITEAVKT